MYVNLHLHVYVYVYMYVRLYLYLYVYLYLYLLLDLHLYVYMYLYLYLYLYLRMLLACVIPAGFELARPGRGYNSSACSCHDDFKLDLRDPQVPRRNVRSTANPPRHP